MFDFSQYQLKTVDTRQYHMEMIFLRIESSPYGWSI